VNFRIEGKLSPNFSGWCTLSWILINNMQVHYNGSFPKPQLQSFPIQRVELSQNKIHFLQMKIHFSRRKMHFKSNSDQKNSISVKGQKWTKFKNPTQKNHSNKTHLKSLWPTSVQIICESCLYIKKMIRLIFLRSNKSKRNFSAIHFNYAL
jgi:hypothetical protein